MPYATRQLAAFGWICAALLGSAACAPKRLPPMTISDLMEVFGDPLFEAHGLTNQDLRELASHNPNVARAVVSLYQGYQAAKETMVAQLEGSDDLTGLDRSRLPSEEVSDLIQRHLNHFPAPRPPPLLPENSPAARS